MKDKSNGVLDRLEFDGWGMRARGRVAWRTLLVEDNLVNQIVAQALLEDLGYVVTLAGNGAEAVDRWNCQPFDVIFIDCQMPVMDGFAATRAIRAAEQRHGAPRIPIVAMTASAMDNDRRRCLESGMDAVLCKPFAADEFVAVMRRWLPDSTADAGRYPERDAPRLAA